MNYLPSKYKTSRRNYVKIPMFSYEIEVFIIVSKIETINKKRVWL